MNVKVLNIITGGLGREGITTTQLELMKAMDKSDIQIDIAAVHDDEEDVIKEFERAGCRVLRFPDRKRELIAYIRKLNYFIRKEKYDVIHVHGSSAIMSIELLIAKIARVKVRIAHSRNTSADHGIVDKLLRPIFYRSYTHGFAVGEEAGKWLFDKREFTIIHNGKDLRKFKFSNEQRLAVRKQFEIGDNVAIGFVGNLNMQKNIPFLLEVIKCNDEINPNCMYFLMGDGPERDNIKVKLREAGLLDKVIMTGRISNISEMLQGMDIMLLPSLFEGVPNVVLEWQAAGLPSIISERITKECKVCDLVKFLPIDQGTEQWITEIGKVALDIDRKEKSDNSCSNMRKMGFDINENVKFIKEFYIKSSQK